MILINNIILVFIVFLIQAWTVDFFSIGTISPDFCIIYILYVSVKEGSLMGTLVGFIFGIILDLSSGTNQFFGLTPLIYSTTGYASGFLDGKYEKLNKQYFTLAWVLIIVFQFLIFSLIYYQNYLVQDPFVFFLKWIGSSLYTLSFLGIFQIIIPIHKLS
mgnify:CR=1 FL=1